MKKLLLLLLINPALIYAGSCCGGGGGTSQIMLGDTKSVFRLLASDLTYSADTDEYANFKSRSQNQLETVRTTTISSSYRLSELWQMGFALPIMEKGRYLNESWQTTTGLSDPSFNIAYEFLPSYTRSKFIPQGFVSAQYTYPLAPALYTTEDETLLDTRGLGHHQYGIGTTFRWLRLRGATLLSVNFNYRPQQSFDSKLFGNVQTTNSLDNTIALTQDIDVSDSLTLSVGASRRFQQSILTSTLIGNSRSSLVHTAQINIGQSIGDYTINLGYTDDFWIGPSYNHMLARSVSLGMIRRVSL
jgi:hypothetical protein